MECHQSLSWSEVNGRVIMGRVQPFDPVSHHHHVHWENVSVEVRRKKCYIARGKPCYHMSMYLHLLGIVPLLPIYTEVRLSTGYAGDRWWRLSCVSVATMSVNNAAGIKGWSVESRMYRVSQTPYNKSICSQISIRDDGRPIRDQFSLHYLIQQSQLTLQWALGSSPLETRKSLGLGIICGPQQPCLHFWLSINDFFLRLL